MRKTKKYTAACQLLSIPVNGDVPHAAVYGMLALRGFEWQSNRWVRGEATLASASIRVSALPDYIQQMADAIVFLIENNGASVTSIKGPYANKKGKQTRLYINFQHPKEW